MKEGRTGEQDIFDIINGRTKTSNVKKKSKSQLHELLVTLEEVYKGSTRELEITRYRICKTCTGTGSNKKGVDTKCYGCNGKGIKLVVRQISMGMIQQQIHCPDCRGNKLKYNYINIY